MDKKNNFINKRINFIEALPLELIHYYIFPFLAKHDFLNLRLVSTGVKAIVDTYLLSPTLKTNVPFYSITTMDDFNKRINNPTLNLIFPCVLILNHIFSTNNQHKKAKFPFIKVYHQTIANKKHFIIEKIEKSNSLNVSFTKNMSISILGNIHTLDLSRTLVTEAPTLKNIHILNLSHTKITDLPTLENIHRLDLSYTMVQDVSALRGIHTLILTQTLVTDVSTLTDVHTLILRETQIKNVSTLGNVYDLDLYETPVTDVSALGKVHTLNLSWTAVTDVSALGHVHTLNLSYTQVKDVSNLLEVHTLNLHNTDVSDVSNLGGTYSLDLSDTKVTDISRLKDVHTLDISDTPVENKLLYWLETNIPSRRNKDLKALCYVKKLIIDFSIKEIIDQKNAIIQRKKEKREQVRIMANSSSFFQSATITSSQGRLNEKKQEKHSINIL